MSKIRYIALIVVSLVAFVSGGNAEAQRLNDKVLNRPYTDMRRWHLGFSVGTHTQDFRFSHNGFVTDDGETWFMEQPSFSPGFCVNGLFSLRLNDYFSVRLTPGMYFGNRVVKMLDTTGGGTVQQDVKSAHVVVPLDIKYSSLRYQNLRPYIVGGVMPAFDVAKKRSDYLKLNTADVYLTVGFGCDFYLPYFKLIPEIKFCFGLSDILQHDRPDLVDDPAKFKYTQSLKRVTSQMVVLSFYFE